MFLLFENDSIFHYLHFLLYFFLLSMTGNALLQKNKIAELMSSRAVNSTGGFHHTTKNLNNSHDKLRLFITHGGYNSLLESAKAEVPLLLIPLFGDQPGNAMRAVRHGMGRQIEKSNLTADSLSEEIGRILSDPIYRRNAHRLGWGIEDKIISNSVLLDHKLRQLAANPDSFPALNKPRNMSLIEFLHLDLAALIVISVYIVVKLCLVLVSFVYRLVTGCRK